MLQVIFLKISITWNNIFVCFNKNNYMKKKCQNGNITNVKIVQKTKNILWLTFYSVFFGKCQNLQDDGKVAYEVQKCK